MRQVLAVGLVSSFLALSLSGCFLYVGDDDECDFGAAEPGGAAPSLGLRNPQSGECLFFGGQPFPCDGVCGPCPVDTPLPAGSPTADPIPGGAAAMPSWGFCLSQCTGLGENTCLTTSGCRGIYDPQGAFSECWSVDMTGPIQGGVCEGLDPWECSRHDDCIAVHESPCGSNNPNPGGPECNAGLFLRCGSEGPTSPGTCYGEVTCDALPPGCPPNSVPGRLNGCWTGTCILVEECEPPPPPQLCAEITSEALCIARVDCTPLYQGADCSCDLSGCTCSRIEFQRCSG